MYAADPIETAETGLELDVETDSDGAVIRPQAQEGASLAWPETKPLRAWAACHFCGKVDPRDGNIWRFIPLLLEDPSRGGKACPDCAPKELRKLVDAGVLIL